MIEMKWEDVSIESRVIMRELGNFSPTNHPKWRMLKGYTCDDEGESKMYYCNNDLRDIALACTEVADWLEKRAESHKGQSSGELPNKEPT